MKTKRVLVFMLVMGLALAPRRPNLEVESSTIPRIITTRCCAIFSSATPHPATEELYTACRPIQLRSSNGPVRSEHARRYRAQFSNGGMPSHQTPTATQEHGSAASIPGNFPP